MREAKLRAQLGKRYSTRKFRPYVTALGQLSLAWNDLQESLALLFWTIMSPRPLEGSTVHHEAIFVWHSIRSDRSQRDMLKEAVNHLTIDWGRPSLVEDANWVLKNSTRLAEWRNDAMHSPLFHSRGGFVREGILPSFWQYNPRAIQLGTHADILEEFRFCRDYATALSDHAFSMNLALVNPGRTWPKRPVLPTRQPKNSRSTQNNRRPRSKSRSLPPPPPGV